MFSNEFQKNNSDRIVPDTEMTQAKRKTMQDLVAASSELKYKLDVLKGAALSPDEFQETQGNSTNGYAISEEQLKTQYGGKPIVLDYDRDITRWKDLVVRAIGDLDILQESLVSKGDETRLVVLALEGIKRNLMVIPDDVSCF